MPEPSATRRRRDFSIDNVSFWLVFLGVPVALFVTLVVWPFLQAGYYSLTDWNGFTPDKNFVGLSNFVDLAHDSTFMRALLNNCIILVVLPIITLGTAFIFANLITVAGTSRGGVSGLRGSGFYRVVSFFPHVIPGIAIGLLWALVLLPRGGLVNGLLTKLGFDSFDGFPWLGDVRSALPVSVLIMAWGLVGFYMLLFIAAIQGVPLEIYEAARLDGAGRLRTAFSITLPLIRDTFQTAAIWIGIFALDAFAYMQALNSGGGPANSTLVITQYLFREAFVKSKFGYASAIGVVLACVTLLFAGLVFAATSSLGRTEKAKR